MQKASGCVHCGPTRVDHGTEKFSVVLDYLFSPIHFFASFWVRLANRIFKGRPSAYFFYGVLKVLERFGVGEFTDDFHHSMNYRTRVMWEEADRRGIKMYGFLVKEKAADVMFAKYGRKFIIFDALPRPLGKKSKAEEWMDNKGKMRKRFSREALPVSFGGMYRTESEGFKRFNELSKPVIVKPSEGSRSRHTTININTEEELVSAIRVAKQLSPWYILEEQLEGFVYRATVIGGKVVGVIRRLPPGVYGDGVRTVRELIDEENKNPLRKGPIFHELETGEVAEAELRRQGLNYSSVPNAGKFVHLHPKVGRSSGAGNIDVTDETHPENILLFEKVSSVLKESLVGIDFIISNISKPYYAQSKSGIIEVNSLPFIDLHHYPLEGKPRDAAGTLWDIVFPESKAK